jgi:hypothetical protein
LAEELSAFIAFCNLVDNEMKSLKEALGFMGEEVEVVPLHPLMVNQKGAPDFGRRAPHPALIFRIKKNSTKNPTTNTEA